MFVVGDHQSVIQAKCAVIVKCQTDFGRWCKVLKNLNAVNANVKEVVQMDDVRLYLIYD